MSYSSQSRIAKLEAVDTTVSLDLMVRSLIVIGAGPTEIAKIIRRAGVSRAASRAIGASVPTGVGPPGAVCHRGSSERPLVMSTRAGHPVFCVPGREEAYADAFALVRWPANVARVSGLDWRADLAPLDMAGQVALVADGVRRYWQRDAFLAALRERRPWPTPSLVHQ